MKKQFRVCLLVCLTVLALVFSSCSWFKSQGKLREDACELIDALLADDFDTFYAAISDACTEEEAREVFPQMREYLGGVTTYELELSHVSTNIKDGEKQRVEQYRMETDAGVFYVEIETRSEIDGIAGFRIVSETEID